MLKVHLEEKGRSFSDSLKDVTIGCNEEWVDVSLGHGIQGD